MNSSPLVSIIIPCYNQAKFLQETLQSVNHQTYSNWECIIINDGSPDNTEEIALEWCYKDVRFKYFKKENGGLSSARNFGILHARGDLILPLDADDKISKNYLSISVEVISKNQGSVIVYGECHYFGSINGLCTLPKYDAVSFLLKNQIHCSGIFYKRDWDKIGGYDEKMKLGNEDWEFWIRMIELGSKVIYCNDMQFYYRQKPNSMLESTLKNKNEINEYIVNKHFHLYEEKLGFIINPYILSNKFKFTKLLYRRVRIKINNAIK